MLWLACGLPGGEKEASLRAVAALIPLHRGEVAVFIFGLDRLFYPNRLAIHSAGRETRSARAADNAMALKELC